MFGKFIEKYFTNLLTWGFGSLFLGIPFIIYFLLKDYQFWGILSLSAFLIVVAYATYSDLIKESEERHKSEIDLANSKVQQSEDAPYRGPKEYKENDYIYQNAWTGDLERYSGEETITLKGKLIYKANYMGGLVDQRGGV